jgi:hypothetical protein
MRSKVLKAVKNIDVGFLCSDAVWTCRKVPLFQRRRLEGGGSMFL